VLEHAGYFPFDSVHPQPQGRALQALVGQGGQERLDEIENPELAMGSWSYTFAGFGEKLSSFPT
jgi:hypothetical protein